MRYLRDYYAPDGYDGCSNCAHQPSPYNLCDYGKEHPSIVVCPKWQMRITKGKSGDEISKITAVNIVHNVITEHFHGEWNEEVHAQVFSMWDKELLTINKEICNKIRDEVEE